MSRLSPEDRKTKERVGFLSAVSRRLRTRRVPIVPHVGPTGAEPKVGGRSGALRAAIFGANDGLVSNLSLIMGVAGAGVENKVVILAGVAGLLAGAFSMAAGEYISVRVQREVFERLIHLEAHEIGTDPELERAELAELYVRKGISEDLAGRLADELMRDPKVALETHAREELGLDPEQGLGSPWAVAGSSFTTFSIGAIVPLVPFWFATGSPAVIASAVLSLVALFGVGAGMSYVTGRSFLASGLRMTAIGGAAALITFGVGKLLNVSTGI
jgi:vacuolar iron transporter family protein